MVYLKWMMLFEKQGGSTINEKLKDVPNNIKKLAAEKLNANPEFTKKIRSKYESLSGQKPTFFAFFCACKWFEKLKKKTNNKVLTIVDYSQWWSGSGKLYMLDTGSNKITLNTTAVQWNWWKDFSNVDGSHKSSLGFCIVDKPCIDPKGNTWPHVVLNWLEPWFNNNMKGRKMYAHGWTRSEWCIVVPVEDRPKFLNTLIWREPWAPVEQGKVYTGSTKGVIFSYAPNANYLASTKYA